MRRPSRLPALLVALSLLPWAAAAAAQDPPEPAPAAAPEESAAKPLLTLESVEVRGPEGRPLGPEALARLTVTLANRGEKIASALVFTVEVEGQELPVYRNQVFLKAIPAGETIELPLYNFWTSETGRAAPADGKLDVAVTLREARWMERSKEEDVEVWTPVGEVAGLPSSAATVVELTSGS